MSNELLRELSIADDKVQYDTQCKRVLSQKEILAWIMRRTVKEFTGMKISDIIPCIEGTPEVSTIGVDPGKSNAEKISGMSTEDKVPGEGAVYYDIRFYAYVPAKEERIRLILNVEAQKSFYPGYEIVTRGIYYAARMISAQLGTEFTHSHYDNIKKVYSIWLGFNAPDKIGNAISEYSIQKRDLLSGLPDLPAAYDKICVIVIALNEKQESEDQFINLMNTLFSADKSYQEKKDKLENDFHIGMNDGFRKELNLMCNLSELVEEKGIKQGIEQAKKEIVISLLKLGTVGEEDIMKAVEISGDQLKVIKEEIAALK